MDKEKSIILSMYEKFLERIGEKTQEEIEDTESEADNEAVSNLSEPKIEDEEILDEEKNTEVITAINQPKESKFDNHLMEFCYRIGFDTDYNMHKDEDTKAFDSRLKILAQDYNKNRLPKENPVDAAVYVNVSFNKCDAYIFVFPPINGGADVSTEMINERIKNLQIKHGLDSDLIENITHERMYCKLLKFAKGELPQDGEDGSIVHTTELNIIPRYSEDAHGNIDFKDLNIVNNIVKHTKICEIILPTLGEDGMSVHGVKLKAKPGKPAQPQNGKNTYLSDDKTVLYSSIDGELALKDGRYFVEPTLRVSGDVDITVGNIDFVGDIHIKGDVKSGYIIKAEGSILVDGSVEAATLIAGEDIIISKGVNGDYSGKITARGKIKCKYLENCFVTSNKSIEASSIINCEVYCNDSIDVTLDKGVIVGGKVNAYNSIVANTIGSKGNRETMLNLGKSKEVIERMSELRNTIKNDIKTFEMIDKNRIFLEKEEHKTPERGKLYIKLLQQSELYKIQIRDNKKELDELEKIDKDYKKCTVRAQMVFPPTQISIADESFKVTNTESSVVFLLSDEGEVIMGVN